MEQREDIRSLVQGLIAAQGSGDPWAESEAILALTAVTHPLVLPVGRRKADESALSRFYKRIVCGASDCWYWRTVRPLGYGACYMLGEVFAHRVSWRLHHGDIPAGLYVLHHCDVRNCVNPDHLFLGTYADNKRDAVAKGRQPRGFTKPNHTQRGERHPRAKLSAADVEAIRQALQTGQHAPALAEQYGVTAGAIYHIAHGRNWQGV